MPETYRTPAVNLACGHCEGQGTIPNYHDVMTMACPSCGGRGVRDDLDMKIGEMKALLGRTANAMQRAASALSRAEPNLFQRLLLEDPLEMPERDFLEPTSEYPPGAEDLPPPGRTHVWDGRLPCDHPPMRAGQVQRACPDCGLMRWEDPLVIPWVDPPAIPCPHARFTRQMYEGRRVSVCLNCGQHLYGWVEVPDAAPTPCPHARQGERPQGEGYEAERERYCLDCGEATADIVNAGLSRESHAITPIARERVENAFSDLRLLFSVDGIDPDLWPNRRETLRTALLTGVSVGVSTSDEIVRERIEGLVGDWMEGTDRFLEDEATPTRLAQMSEDERLQLGWCIEVGDSLFHHAYVAQVPSAVVAGIEVRLFALRRVADIAQRRGIVLWDPVRDEG